ncbi:putative orfan [Tupanvirus soda lake]|uniref:Orfan n=1 Tax=Tupanvirus deep ocean TaxID=2126984 RepID=A0AC59HC74_9VIRU|nr:putative orfan [Tupanvirus soda lake]AUL78196.2 putative orfan [Tupanvirus soda lake]
MWKKFIQSLTQRAFQQECPFGIPIDGPASFMDVLEPVKITTLPTNQCVVNSTEIVPVSQPSLVKPTNHQSMIIGFCKMNNRVNPFVPTNFYNGVLFPQNTIFWAAFPHIHLHCLRTFGLFSGKKVVPTFKSKILCLMDTVNQVPTTTTAEVSVSIDLYENKNTDFKTKTTETVTETKIFSFGAINENNTMTVLENKKNVPTIHSFITSKKKLERFRNKIIYYPIIRFRSSRRSSLKKGKKKRRRKLLTLITSVASGNYLAQTICDPSFMFVGKWPNVEITDTCCRVGWILLFIHLAKCSRHCANILLSNHWFLSFGTNQFVYW